VLHKETLRVTTGAFSPDGRRVATGGFDRLAWIWDAATGELLSPPLRHRNVVSAAAFSPDGRLLATASGMVIGPGGEARVWDASSGEPVTPPLLHDKAAEVEHVAFSPDGRRIASGARDQTARVWELPIDDRPVPDLVRLAEAYSGARIGATGSPMALSGDALLDAWKSSGAGTRAAPREDRQWHRTLADLCIADGAWDGAIGHLTALLELEAGDRAALMSRARAQERLGRRDRADADYDTSPSAGSSSIASRGRTTRPRARRSPRRASAARYPGSICRGPAPWPRRPSH
jgi:hypothetical protein